MHVKLISNDRELLKLCREIVANLEEENWILSAALPEEAGADADVYLWDYQPDGKLLPDRIHGTSTHLFLVHRQDLPRFREQINPAKVNVLLKPVTQATLEVFLAQA